MNHIFIDNLPEASSTLAWLNEFQRRELIAWRDQTLPSRKTENWKYTNIKSLLDGKYTPLLQVGLVDDVPTKLQLDGTKIVFINGVYSNELSQISSNQNIEICRFADASDEQKSKIENSLNTNVDKTQHPFSVLNSSQFTDGVLVRIKKNSHNNDPIHLIHVASSQERNFTVAPRTIIDVEEGANASLVEHFCSTAEHQNVFFNSITEIKIQANAKLKHYRIHESEENAHEIGGVHVELFRNATFDSFNALLGSQLCRLDFVVKHRGEGAHCNLNGLYLPKNRQHVDVHTTIEHCVPHCTSSEVFRGIVSDRSRAVFNGRIHIHPNAQKTLAQLSNKNLLTSNTAEVDTKPELEIYADDVQCAHGATVAQLSEESLHYFLTRGISKSEAKVMMSFGFINELINEISDPKIATYIRDLISGLFSEDKKLLEHIGT